MAWPFFGHIAMYCRGKGSYGNGRKDGDEKGTKPNVRAAMARTSTGFPSFIVDPGASQHIGNDLSIFTSIQDISPVPVHLAADTVVEAVRRIDLHSSYRASAGNVTLELQKVLHISEAGISMLSCAQLDKKRISIMI